MAAPLKTTLPAEFSSDCRVWHQMVIFIAVLCCVGGFVAGVIRGHPWRYSVRWALVLPAIFTPIFWLMGLYSAHRSYVVTQDGIVFRRRGRTIEQLSWAEIADVRAWPLAIITRSGRKIVFHLAREDMERARDTLLHVFRNA